MAFCDRQQKQFAIRKPLFERTFCAPCTSASVERVFTNEGYLLGHRDASKAQRMDCGKLLSLGSNKPGKQTVHGLKCATKIYTVHEETGVPSTRTPSRPPAKKAKLDEALVAHCRADLMTECMKKKRKTLIISGDFRFRFSAENMSKYDFVSFSAVNGISFSSAFSFTAEK